MTGGGRLGPLIRARRRELGLTLQDVASFVGCTKGYLSTIENERREHPPSAELLAKLERALRLGSGSLVNLGSWHATPESVRRQVMTLEAERHTARRLASLLARGGLDALHRSGELKRLVDRLTAPEGSAGSAGSGERAREIAGKLPASVDAPWVLPRQVPVVNRVSAGYPKEFTDLGYPARVADEYVSVPDVYDADAFAARVVGDSMEPAYREGDIVVFSPVATPTAGSDCFVRLDRDDETTFKRVYFETDGEGRELIRLQPLNSAYPPRVLEREAVAGLYAAVYVVRAVGGGAV